MALPITLQKLTLEQTEIYRYPMKGDSLATWLLEELRHLPHLKHLEIKHDGQLKDSTVRSLLELAFIMDFRVLSLKHRQAINSHTDSNRFQPINNHCMSYRRKVVQCLLMQRYPGICDSFWREFVLEAAEHRIEQEGGSEDKPIPAQHHRFRPATVNALHEVSDDDDRDYYDYHDAYYDEDHYGLDSGDEDEMDMYNRRW